MQHGQKTHKSLQLHLTDTDTHLTGHRYFHITKAPVTHSHERKCDSRTRLTLAPTIPTVSRLAEHPAADLSYSEKECVSIIWKLWFVNEISEFTVAFIRCCSDTATR